MCADKLWTCSQTLGPEVHIKGNATSMSETVPMSLVASMSCLTWWAPPEGTEACDSGGPCFFLGLPRMRLAKDTQPLLDMVRAVPFRRARVHFAGSKDLPSIKVKLSAGEGAINDLKVEIDGKRVSFTAELLLRSRWQERQHRRC